MANYKALSTLPTAYIQILIPYGCLLRNSFSYFHLLYLQIVFKMPSTV